MQADWRRVLGNVVGSGSAERAMLSDTDGPGMESQNLIHNNDHWGSSSSSRATKRPTRVTTSGQIPAVSDFTGWYRVSIIYIYICTQPATQRGHGLVLTTGSVYKGRCSTKLHCSVGSVTFPLNPVLIML